MRRQSRVRSDERNLCASGWNQARIRGSWLRTRTRGACDCGGRGFGVEDDELEGRAGGERSEDSVDGPVEGVQAVVALIDPHQHHGLLSSGRHESLASSYYYTGRQKNGWMKQKQAWTLEEKLRSTELIYGEENCGSYWRETESGKTRENQKSPRERKFWQFEETAGEGQWWRGRLTWTVSGWDNVLFVPSVWSLLTLNGFVCSYKEKKKKKNTRETGFVLSAYVSLSRGGLRGDKWLRCRSNLSSKLKTL